MSRSGGTLTTVAVVALSSWSCGSTAPNATPEVAEIVVSPATSTLAPNAQLPLRAQVQDGSGALVPDAEVTWTVQDPRIVSISAAGVVTALALGTSQVAASSFGKSGLAIITVKPEVVNTGAADPGTVAPSAVASVVVTAPSKKVKPGATMQLAATALDSKGNPVPHQSFYWSSSNTNIATVSAGGVVTGKRPGTVTITAQTSVTGGTSGSLQIDVK
jgi:pullulanase